MFSIEALPANYIPRPSEHEAIVQALLDRSGSETVGITTALRGAGGFGKTLLARAVCHDPRVQAAFPDGIYWVTLRETPANLIGQMVDLIFQVTGKTSGFNDLDQAAGYFHAHIQGKKILIVIDDVWRNSDLKLFLQGGSGCAHLITTRNDEVLPRKTRRVLVDKMEDEQAINLLGVDFPARYRTELKRLVISLGKWPLLLSLANNLLVQRVQDGDDPRNAIQFVSSLYDLEGTVAFDLADDHVRQTAVKRTIDASLNMLSSSTADRYRELVIFPEDQEIALATVELLWKETGSKTQLQTERLCQEFSHKSLIQEFSLQSKCFRLHDVIRTYFIQNQDSKKIQQTHGNLIDAYRKINKDKWHSGPDDLYYFNNLAYHLQKAEQLNALEKLLLDFDWIEKKLSQTNIYSVLSDFSYNQPSSESVRTIHRTLTLCSHILAQYPHQLAAQILGRLGKANEEDLQQFIQNARQWEKSTWLRPERPSLTSKFSNLVNNLVGHTKDVNGVLLVPDGRILSWSMDHTLRLWDLTSAQPPAVLEGHT